MSDFNTKIIEEIRANAGVVGGPFKGANLLLLHTEGARSGAARVNPLAWFALDGKMLIVASFAGAENNPPWYFNLLAHPDVRIEIGADEYAVRAIVIDEPARTSLYARIAAMAPTFATYQEKTSRPIPLIELVKTA